jgi:hypothetical protein
MESPCFCGLFAANCLRNVLYKVFDEVESEPFVSYTATSLIQGGIATKIKAGIL